MQQTLKWIEELRVDRKFFHLFDPGEIELLGRMFETVELPAGTLLAEEGTRSDGHFEVIVSGLIEVKKATEFGRSLIFAKLGRGTILGQIGLSESSWPFPITMVTLDDTVLLRLNRENGRFILDNHPRTAIKFLMEIIRVMQIRTGELATRFSSIF